MGSEGRLAPRNRRRLEGVVGVPLSFAIATHSGWVVGVTLGPNHKHIYWNRKTGEIDRPEPGDGEPVHWYKLCEFAEEGIIEPNISYGG